MFLYFYVPCINAKIVEFFIILLILQLFWQRILFSQDIIHSQMDGEHTICTINHSWCLLLLKLMPALHTSVITIRHICFGVDLAYILRAPVFRLAGCFLPVCVFHTKEKKKHIKSSLQTTAMRGTTKQIISMIIPTNKY